MTGTWQYLDLRRRGLPQQRLERLLHGGRNQVVVLSQQVQLGREQRCQAFALIKRFQPIQTSAYIGRNLPGILFL
jgi:transcriptional regulator